ncbi:hypothetical protein NDA11_007854 [Ustilago hordei]|nr:hypothetical protein NDA11_007854 [Ustilago hordei]
MSSIKALQIEGQGGPEVVQVVPIQPPTLEGKGKVIVRNEYAGVNMIDTYHFGGLYPLETPVIIGQEAAGVVEAVSPDVTWLAPGDKVVQYGGGSYSEKQLVDAQRVIKLPDTIDTKTAAASYLQGLTALTLLKEAHPVKQGDWLLVTAAAGATHAILYNKENRQDYIKQVMSLTNNHGVDGILDGVGADTWEANFTIAARKGTIVTFGNASGPVPSFAPLKLAAKNLKVCRPTLFNYVSTRQERESYSKELFDLVESGKVKINVHEQYEFSTEGMRKAFADIKSRKTTGKLIVKI